MNLKTKIHLNKFKPRKYQLPIIKALEVDNYRKLLCILPRRCLSQDTDIIMHNGSIKKIKDISPGDKILSFDGKKVVIDTVINKWETGFKETIKVRAASYLPIITSQDHKFFDGQKWIFAKDLKNKTLQYAGCQSKINKPDLSELIGFLTHDGYVTGYQQPKFTNSNIEILNRVEYLVKKVFKYNIIWRKKGNSFDLGITNGTKGGGTYKNDVKELFRKYNLDVPKSKKRILPEVFDYDEQSILRYFAGVIAADGSIYTQQKERIFKTKDGIIKKIKPTSEITIHCGVSKELAYDTYWLLRKISIIPHEPKLEKDSNWKIRISQGPQILKLLENVTIYGKQHKQKIAIQNARQFHKTKKIINGLYHPIKLTKEKAETSQTYDIETKNNHNFFANGYLVHNSGKDFLAFNLAIRQLIKKVCTIFYIFPTYSQARKALWDAISIEGERILDCIPKELIESKNSSEMKITFVNGSILQFVGSDNYDRLVGTNPYGCIFSEYALQDPRAYQFIRPILAANSGWAMMISTPRGKNAMWDLYQIAQNSDDWFCYKLTLDDTKHIPYSEIEKERKEGLMSEDLIQQEYFTSFSAGVEGAYYSKYLDKMRLKNQITIVPWESSFPVHTAWDIGVRDSTAIIFFQTIGQSVRLIDFYENSKQGLEYYVKILNQKDYQYGKHIAPHDIAVKEFGSGMTRLEKAKRLGIKFTVAPKLPIEDGIEAVRSSFSKMYIDEKNCKQLIRAIENYRQEYDSKKQIYKAIPLHNWASHACFTGESKVLTVNGYVKIKDVNVGDEVITPLGNRKILNKIKKYADNIYNIKGIECTAEHQFFCNRGLVRCDMLRYPDVLEPYNKIRTFLWKKIFGYFIGEQDLKGFKKTILSQKMKNRSCLMDTFIHGMNQNTIWEDLVELKKVVLLRVTGFIQHCKDIFGKNIKVPLKKGMSFIIKMVIQRIIKLKILKCLQSMNMDIFMQQDQHLGVIQRNVKKCLPKIDIKQPSGIKVKQEENGIKNTQKTHYPLLRELNIKKYVWYVRKNILGNKHGKNTVPISVKQNIVSLLGRILRKGIVLFVVKSLNVINTLSKKHVVKSVQLFQLRQPREVFDLTIEKDNCYYVNGYLVSNCDSLRYLCISLPKTRDSLSPEELDKRYQETLYGNKNLPHFFR